MQQVFVIHGGDAFDTYDEYLAYLRAKKVDLSRLRYKDWKLNLGERLGAEFEVVNPAMPNKQNAKYFEWKIWFEKHISFLRSDIILIGHSLGGIFLAKYLSEETFPVSIRAVMLVAAPFNTATQHPLADFNLSDDLGKLAAQAGKVFLYHSTDDVVVPYTNVESYRAVLPDAEVRTFADRGHFNDETFPELEDVIRGLDKNGAGAL